MRSDQNHLKNFLPREMPKEPEKKRVHIDPDSIAESHHVYTFAQVSPLAVSSLLF